MRCLREILQQLYGLILFALGPTIDSIGSDGRLLRMAIPHRLSVITVTS